MEECKFGRVQDRKSLRLEECKIGRLWECVNVCSTGDKIEEPQYLTDSTCRCVASSIRELHNFEDVEHLVLPATHLARAVTNNLYSAQCVVTVDAAATDGATASKVMTLVRMVMRAWNEPTQSFTFTEKATSRALSGGSNLFHTFFLVNRGVFKMHFKLF